MRITPTVKEFIEKYVAVIEADDFEYFNELARKELDAFQIVELMLVMSESGIFEDHVNFNI